MENTAQEIVSDVDTGVDALETEVNDVETSEIENQDGESGDNAGEGKKPEKDELEVLRKRNDKLNRYSRNLRQRMAEQDRKLQELMNASKQPSDKAAPQMEQFESVLEYMEAKNKYDLEQKFAEHGNQQQITALQQQQQMMQAQIDEENFQKYQELATVNPDVKAVVENPEIQAIVNSLPPHIDALFNHVDNPVLAGYVLAKEGRLAELAYMHPQVALVEIVQAMHRGAQYMQTPVRTAAPNPAMNQMPQKQPPAPIGSLKGAGKSSTKPLNQMSGGELMDWLKK